MFQLGIKFHRWLCNERLSQMNVIVMSMKCNVASVWNICSHGNFGLMNESKQ